MQGKCNSYIIKYLFALLFSLPHPSMKISKFTSFSFFFPMLFIYLLLPQNSKVVEACSAATDCGAGFYCGHCPGLSKRTRSVCTRGQATLVTSIVSVSDSIPMFLLFLKHLFISCFRLSWNNS